MCYFNHSQDAVSNLFWRKSLLFESILLILRPKKHLLIGDWHVRNVAICLFGQTPVSFYLRHLFYWHSMTKGISLLFFQNRVLILHLWLKWEYCCYKQYLPMNGGLHTKSTAIQSLTVALFLEDSDWHYVFLKGIVFFHFYPKIRNYHPIHD